MKQFLGFFVIMVTAVLLIYSTPEMPDWGDPNSPASKHVSPRYIEKADQETHSPNMVTAVLADYRGYDTMGETMVVFTSAVGCLMLLRRRQHK